MSPSRQKSPIIVRNMLPGDFPGVQDIATRIYPLISPWSVDQLRSHLEVFPEGQFVADDRSENLIVGSCSALILRWDDYDKTMTWSAFTDGGMYTNHDPVRGRTLYAADVMVRPGYQGRGVGKKLYKAGRFDLARTLGLLRIRAGARLRGYHKVSRRMTPEEYVRSVVNGRRRDATLSFQLKQGFHVLGVIHDYIRGDPESLGNAALIEWINEQAVRVGDRIARNPDFEPDEPERGAGTDSESTA